MKNKRSKFFIILGLLLIGAALCLTIYNICEDYMARTRTVELLAQLEEQQEARSTVKEELKEDMIANELSLYEKYPDMEMAVQIVDGIEYIGTLEIPILDSKLPVISEWSYPNLRIAPCRYKGSIYKGDLILAAHNYSSHFGEIKNLLPGDSVKFYDVNQQCFSYEVVEKEVLDGTAMEEMEAGDWDLTLFTCTYGGRTRETIRCVQVDEEKELLH